MPAGFSRSPSSPTGYTNGHMGTALCATSRVDTLNHFLDAQCNITEYAALCDTTKRMTKQTVTGTVAQGDFHNPSTGDGSCTYGKAATLPDGTAYDNCEYAPAGPPGSTGQNRLVALNAVDPNYPKRVSVQRRLRALQRLRRRRAGQRGQPLRLRHLEHLVRRKNTARIYFNLGDSNFTTDEVLWAMKTVRAHRSLFPVSTRPLSSA